MRITFTIYDGTKAYRAIPCTPEKHCSVGYLELLGSVSIANIHQSLMESPILLLNKKYVGVILDTI